MTKPPKIRFLSTTALQIGYRKSGSDVCIARTPELEIHAGDFICLLGPNGAGKSTLIRTLSGLQMPLRGTVALKNRPYNRLSPRERARNVSLVLTEMPSPDMLDAYSLVALGRHPHSGKFGLLGHKDRALIDWAFAAVDATHLKNCQISYLSDGERQKLLIARALAQETPLMLLDEPTVFLDLPRQTELMVTLLELVRQKQMGILLSTHNLDLALRFADYIWLIDKDGALTRGYPEELVLNGAISRTFSGNKVVWNIQNGAFSVQKTSTLSAFVQGNGAAAFWTQRALERLGFMITESGDKADIEVTLSETKQRTEWSVKADNHEKRSIPSLEVLIDWVSGNDWGSVLSQKTDHQI